MVFLVDRKKELIKVKGLQVLYFLIGFCFNPKMIRSHQLNWRTTSEDWRV